MQSLVKRSSENQQQSTQKRNSNRVEFRTLLVWIHSKSRERPRCQETNKRKESTRLGLNLQSGRSKTLDEGSNAEVLHTDTACSSPGGGAAAESSGCSSAGLLLLVKSDSRLARGRRLAQPDVLPSGSWVLGGHLLIC